MRNIVYILSISLLAAACEIETTGNGSLDGNWQLHSIDTLATSQRCDMSNSYIYWGITSHILQIRDIDNSNLKILFNLKKEDNKLRLFSPHNVITKDKLIALENDSLLQPLGITSLQEDFLIERSDNSQLVLKNELYRLSFKKY